MEIPGTKRFIPKGFEVGVTIGPFIPEKISRRNYLYEYKLPGQEKPRVEKAVKVDLVPFIPGVCVLCKPRLIFSRVNGPIELAD